MIQSNLGMYTLNPDICWPSVESPAGKGGLSIFITRYILAHRCTIFLCYLGAEIYDEIYMIYDEIYDDQDRNPNLNNRDHLVGQLTRYIYNV